ncbi:MAG: hypothetical protein KF803_10565 [Cyclobacteriaceae bacterium]|nr:hypothetical protein [Cyclobacteriaceae bacterium]
MNLKKRKVIVFKIFVSVLIAIITFLGCSTKENDYVQTLKVDENLKDTLRVILHEGQLKSEKTGYELNTSPQYYRVNWVIKNSTSSDLESLIQSENGMLKAIGFKGLYRRQEKNWYNHLINIMSDTTSYLYYKEGSLGETMKVSEFCLRKVIHYEILDSSSPVINSEQRKEINDLIVRYNLKVRIRE